MTWANTKNAKYLKNGVQNYLHYDPICGENIYYNILSIYVNFKRPKQTSSYQYLSLEGRIKSDLNFLLSTFVTTIRKKIS